MAVILSGIPNQEENLALRNRLRPLIYMMSAVAALTAASCGSTPEPLPDVRPVVSSADTNGTSTTAVYETPPAYETSEAEQDADIVSLNNGTDTADPAEAVIEPYDNQFRLTDITFAVSP